MVSHMTAANRAWRKAIKSAKGGGRSKYNNKKVVIDGYKFDSKKEGNRYVGLKVLLQSGIIKDLELQKEYKFVHEGKLICKYIADFCYWDSTKPYYVVEDAKGVRTQVYKIKKKMMRIFYGIEIFET